MNIQDPAEGADRSAAVPAPPAPFGRGDRAWERTDAEFAAFYREELRPLVGFLINQGARVRDAADIAQESMTDAYRCWGDITYPKAWVHKAASRALIRKVADVEELVEDVPEPTSLLPRPDAIAEWEARHDALFILRDLPPRQRQVMAWTLNGFTPTDIAEHLGLSAEAVRANLKKARRAAAARIGEREEDQ
ncbi:sigma-70 family RNA polymerase sigma factor [Streptomyces sp. V2I9]|uniref:sigma-70 family RNA polymerase sigma factor n=1 Tax=Streptomyces sp. V2I9 TaxID=3042304 RepID=UPI002787A267|nr:sigma-70 family RNA polymerase sigma factor [Streptomyces sp. V2I9]MDQ0983234.1 RNA polymerase sigma factor (sigma-70 family) [Streptomyces sp. V2I9]